MAEGMASPQGFSPYKFHPPVTERVKRMVGKVLTGNGIRSTSRWAGSL